MKELYLCYAEVLTSIEELKIEVDFELRNQKKNGLSLLRTLKKSDEVYKKSLVSVILLY